MQHIKNSSLDVESQLDDIIDVAHALELALRGLRAIASQGVSDGHARGLETQAFELRQRIEKFSADLADRPASC